MPQSKEVHKEYMRAKRRKGSQIEGVHSEGSQIPGSMLPILTALSDIKMRAKLRLICEELKTHHVSKEVRYGVSGPTMDIVGELLEAF